MIVFTIIGLLVFWCWCFEVGYWLVPTFHTIRVALMTRLLGSEVERLVSVINARVEVPRG